MPKPVAVTATLELDAFEILRELVSSGAVYGVRRWLKHRVHTMSEAEIRSLADEVELAIMAELGEVVIDRR